MTLALCAGRYGWQSKAEYWRLAGGGKEDSLGRWLGRGDRGTRWLLSVLLYVPAANYLMQAVMCGFVCGSVFLVAAFALPAAVLCTLADHCFTVNIACTANNPGPIAPQYTLKCTASDLAIALLVPLCSSQHAFLLLALVLVLGLAKASLVYRDLPFHLNLSNVVESFKGVFLVWEVALLALAANIPQAELAPGLLLLLGIPTLAVIDYSVVSYRSRTFLAHGIRSEAQHAKAIQFSCLQPIHTSNSEDSSLQDPPTTLFRMDKLSIFPLFWTAYYYLRAEEYYFAKLAVGLIRESDKNWRNRVQIDTCIARLQTQLQKNQEEKTLQRFLMLDGFLTKVQLDDNISSILLRDFYEGLERRNMQFERIVNISRLLSHQTKKTAAAYARLVETFPKRASLQAAYSSYLCMIGKEQVAGQYKQQALKLAERKRKRVISGVDRLIQDDDSVILVVVPLTGREKGKIAWSVNASLLGYTEDTLKGQNCSILLPIAFQKKHEEMLAQLPSKRTIPLVTSAILDLNIYVRKRTGELLCGVWRLFCANDRNTGQLLSVTSIRIQPSPKDFVILSPSGELMECTPDFMDFTRETSFLEEWNRSSEDVVWKGQWRGTLVLASKDLWRVSERYEIPCISLFKMRGRRGASLGKATIVPKPAYNLMETKHLFISNASLVSSKDPDTGLRSVDSSKTIKGETEAISLENTKSRLKHLGRGLACLIILTCIGGSAVALAVEGSFALSVLQVNESIAHITSIGMRVLSIRAAIRSKELYLLNTGFSLYGNETTARADLKGVGASFKAMQSYLYGNSSSATGGYRKLLLEPITPFWRFESDRFERYQVTLLDLMDEMARRTAKLANCSLGNITRKNSDFMTLYRNGAAEALGAFNASVALYGKSKDMERDQVLTAMKLAAFIAPTVCFVFFTSLIGELLFLLERKRKEIWKSLLALPKNVVAQAREALITRVDSLRYEDFLSSQHTTLTLPCHYRSSGLMKALTATLLIYSCVMSLSGLGMYLYGYSTMSTVLIYKPGYTDWHGMRRAATAKGWFHMREAWLPGNLSYSAIVSDTQTFYSHLRHWEQASSLLVMAQKCITLGCEMHELNHLFPSDIHKDLLLGTAGNTSIALSAGLSPFLNEIVQLSSAARADLQSDPKVDYSKGKKLEKYISLAFTAITQSNQQFDTDTAADLEAASRKLKQISTVLVCAAFLVLLVMLVLLNRVRDIQVLESIRSEADAFNHFSSASRKSKGSNGN